MRVIVVWGSFLLFLAFFGVSVISDSMANNERKIRNGFGTQCMYNDCVQNLYSLRSYQNKVRKHESNAGFFMFLSVIAFIVGVVTLFV